MLAIKFSRKGKKHQPFFRVIILEKSKDPWGDFLEDLGYYNPLTKEVSLKKERIEYWIKNGAQPTDSVHNLLVSQEIIKADKVKATKLNRKKAAKKAEKAEETAKTEDEVKPADTDEKSKEKDKIEEKKEIKEIKETNNDDQVKEEPKAEEEVKEILKEEVSSDNKDNDGVEKEDDKEIKKPEKEDDKDKKEESKKEESKKEDKTGKEEKN